MLNDEQLTVIETAAKINADGIDVMLVMASVFSMVKEIRANRALLADIDATLVDYLKDTARQCPFCGGGRCDAWFDGELYARYTEFDHADSCLISRLRTALGVEG